MPLEFSHSTFSYAPDMAELYEEILDQSPQDTCLVCQAFDEDAQVLAGLHLTEYEKISIIRDWW